jgi:xanthine dehydrogenase accessory factor
VVLATALDDAEDRLIRPDEADPGTEDEGAVALREAAREALRTDSALTRELGGRRWLLNPYNPPQRMILVGAVHIAQTLAPMAAQAGFDVTVIDPRRAFATAERFPGVALDTRWPDEALAERAPDRRTAVVTLTHDPKLDDPALAAALRTGAFYVGALGSSRTHAARCERLREMGFDDAAIGRIHGPVGFAIGARGPAEIAVSILAQAVAVLRQAA